MAHDYRIARAIFESLSWYHHKRRTCQRRPGFSTWTWAGWTQAVRWAPFSLPWASPLVQNVRYTTDVSPASYLLLQPGLSQNSLDTVVAIHIDVPCLPHTALPRSLRLAATWESILGPMNDGDGLLAQLPDCTLEELHIALEVEHWSCVLLGYEYENFQHIYPSIQGQSAFFLIVQWIDDMTAERIGGFCFKLKISVKEVTALKGRTVRLI